jgi:hypothetical protein
LAYLSWSSSGKHFPGSGKRDGCIKISHMLPVFPGYILQDLRGLSIWAEARDRTQSAALA